MAGAEVKNLPEGVQRIAAALLAQGHLVQVLKHIRFAQAGSRITAVYHSRRLQSPRVRAFLDFLVELTAG